MEEILSEDEQQLVIFKLSNEAYGIDISKIQEIIRLQEITHIPKVSHFIEGVINLRGNVIPVIDLRKRFDFEKVERDNSTRIIVVEVGEYVVGMIVDAVLEVVRVSNENIEPPSNIISDIKSDYLTGVCKLDDKLIILLDISKVLTPTEQSELANVG